MKDFAVIIFAPLLTGALTVASAFMLGYIIMMSKHLPEMLAVVLSAFVILWILGFCILAVIGRVRKESSGG